MEEGEASGAAPPAARALLPQQPRRGLRRRGTTPSAYSSPGQLPTAPVVSSQPGLHRRPCSPLRAPRLPGAWGRRILVDVDLRLDKSRA
jgi:hypothetical protein